MNSTKNFGIRNLSIYLKALDLARSSIVVLLLLFSIVSRSLHEDVKLPSAASERIFCSFSVCNTFWESFDVDGRISLFLCWDIVLPFRGWDVFLPYEGKQQNDDSIRHKNSPNKLDSTWDIDIEFGVQKTIKLQKIIYPNFNCLAYGLFSTAKRNYIDFITRA